MKRLSLSEISIVSFSCVLHHLREEGTIFECIRRALNLQIRIFLLNSAIIVLNTTDFPLDIAMGHHHYSPSSMTLWKSSR